MNWLLVALLAQFILGSSALFDKLLLKKSYPNPLGYAFWLGVVGLVSLVLIPFGFHWAWGWYIIVALLAGAAFMGGMIAYVQALYDGEASLATVAVAAFSPLTAFLVSSILLGTQLHIYELMAFCLLVLGGLLLVVVHERHIRVRMLWLTASAGLLLGISTILSKQVFDTTSFLTGFVWIKIGAAVVALALLAVPAWRKRILLSTKHDQFRNKYLYLGNRAYAGAGSILISYAVSLGVPPLVEALSSVRFLILFLGGWLILKEHFRGRALASKIGAFIFISIGVALLGLGSWARETAPNPTRPIIWGVTFSDEFAIKLGLDWKETYQAILHDLPASHLRISAYWDKIEPEPGKFDFSRLDYQVTEAERAGAQLTIVVGKKAPRWPECHEPDWVHGYADAAKETELHTYIKEVVSRYKHSPAVSLWQVENEPFLAFGECTPSPSAFLDGEIALVRILDPMHQILITDGGEFGRWYQAASRGDTFGTTMYRRVHSDTFGYFDYHLPPAYFRLKTALVRSLTGQQNKKFMVIELALEPWLQHQLYETNLKDQFYAFDLPFFRDTIHYAKAAGFDEYYTWGAEWWYWLKVKHGDSRYWEEAKTLFVK